jgi:hypothetical protein
MPTFPSADPISVTVDVTGDVRITASDRGDTVVEVRPGDPSKAADIKAAEQTTVEFSESTLLIKMPKQWRQWMPFSGHGAIDLTIELPTRSRVIGDSAFGRFSAEGELGECELKTAMGNIRLDHTGRLQAHTSYGNIAVDRVVGDAELTTGSGDVRVEEVDGTAVIKNSNGGTTIGEVTGDLRVKASNGDIAVRRAHRAATAKPANGDVRIGEVRSGPIVLETAAGDLEVGIRPGTAAWLDVATRFGSVRNTLDASDAPPPSDARVEVRARTSIGDILIGRAPSDNAANLGGSDAR